MVFARKKDHLYSNNHPVENAVFTMNMKTAFYLIWLSRKDKFIYHSFGDYSRRKAFDNSQRWSYRPYSTV